ncbi:hypothetical protein EDC94DRAFT_593914 [Helicostylum pulchrum]|uniref:Uncharacterized protein n=1 Tax=Helicostylum pulchrum TaxID=562976 RepID=A0ABP9XVX3_9FUNG|nr:hypothetical protein EDC94DRAFT_593914 [Helicostylum pulchrum]
MGCCISHDKVGTIEVVVDRDGVARRVPSGQGTHLIRTFPDKETKMERKVPTKPSELSGLSRPQAAYYPAKSSMLTSCFPTKKVHPNITLNEKDGL